MAISKHFKANQVQGVRKLGNVMFPGGEGFPSFSDCDCVRHLDRILDFMPEQDLKDLGMLALLLAWLPKPVVRFFIWILDRGVSWPGPIGAQLRTIRLGVRGLILSLYYGDPAVQKEVGYEVSVYVGDLKT
jgi:hypothetical protein